MIAQAPEDDVRSWRTSAGTRNDLGARSASMFDENAEPVLRSRRGALRLRPAAAGGARLLRQVPGPDPVREGQLSARRISVLLARVRNQRRVLRLLPRLPRVLEAVRHRPARRGAEEALLPERAASITPGPAAAPASPTDGELALDLDTMASYLVTGGAGFIGSHLAEELVRRGHRSASSTA